MMFLKKRLGQHFLRDKNILALEAKLLAPAGETVLEIGPGDGRFTEQLLLAGAKKIIAVEKDPRMCEILRERFASAPVSIMEADFLETIPAVFGSIQKIAGNIPYYISSPIVFKLKDFNFREALLMVQDEFARKMVAQPGSSEYGRLSITSQLFYEVKYVRKVSSHLFTPPPKVDSAIIQLKKKPVNVTPEAENVIRALFQHKNKTVRNALTDSGFKPETLPPLGQLLLKRPRALTQEEVKLICGILDKNRVN